MTEQLDSMFEDHAMREIDADLRRLYGTATVPPLHFDASRLETRRNAHSARARAVRRWFRPAALVAAGTAIAVTAAVFGVMLLSGDSSAVVTSASAQALLERSSGVASVDGAAIGTSYHLVGHTTSSGKGGGTTETWFQDATHFRTQQWVSTDDRSVPPTFGESRDGPDIWLFEADGARTRVAHGPADALGIGVGDKVYDAQSLAQLLAGYSVDGCFRAERTGVATVANRQAVVVNVVPTPDTCAPGPGSPKIGIEAGATTTIAIDEDTALPLRIRTVLNDGRQLMSYEVSEVQIGAAAPATSFHYQPPAGATVADVTDASSAKAALRLSSSGINK